MDKLKKLCIQFLKGEFDIFEFQNRLTTLENYGEGKELNVLKELDNKLEEIIYCHNPENYYENVFLAIKAINVKLENDCQ